MKKILSLLFLSGYCFVATAQYSFSGKVINESKQPLAGVNIAINNNIQVAVTDTAGNYNFIYTSNNIDLSFSHVGFVTYTIPVHIHYPAVVTLIRNSDLLEDAVVKAFERNSTAGNVAAAITVLSKASLERYNGQSFVPAINTVPGVKMDERSPGSYRLSIRGNLLRSAFGIRNVKVYWNGIPFTDANGNTYFNQLALNNIGKIELIKGPSGSMYGAGTGGVVLLSTPVPAAKEKHLVFQSSAGSYGTFLASAAYDQVGNNTQSISFTHQESKGYRVHTNMRRDVANYSGSYLVNAKQRVSANVFYSDLYYQTPGGLTLKEMQTDPRQARPAAGIFPGAGAQQAAIYLKTIYGGIAREYRFNDKWSNTTSAYGSYTGFKNPSIRNYEDKLEKGIGGRTVFQYKGPRVTHTIGGEYQHSFVNTGVYGNRSGIKDTLQYNDKIRSVQYNLFFQSDFALKENFILSAGISYNRFRYRLQRVNEIPVETERTDFAPQFVPRIAALFKIKNISIYAAVSKGYSPPSIDEVHASDGNFNVQLKPETGINYEAGIKGAIVKDILWIDMAYYIFGLHNTIVSRRDSGGADYYVNAGNTRQQGAEAGIHYLPVNNHNRFLRQLKFWISYTNIYAKFRQYQQGINKYDGNRLTGTPSNVFVAGVDINTAIKIYSNFTYSYTGKIPLNDANTFSADPYNLFCIKAGYRATWRRLPDADFFISYQRSLNTPYSLGNDLNAAGNRYFNPSAPADFTVGAKFRFAVNSASRR